MVAKLTEAESTVLMESQPVGTDLMILIEGDGVIFRKLDTGLWHEVDSEGTSRFGWEPSSFRLDLERETWAFM